MSNWRIPLKMASVLLIVLGLLISGAAAASAISDARQTALDQADAPGQLSSGFDPIIVPDPKFIGPRGAPSLLPQTSGLPRDLQTSPASVQPAGRPAHWQDPAAGEGFSPDFALPEGASSTATPPPVWIPDRIVIPDIQLDAPVILATLKTIEYQGKFYKQWVAPNSFDAGLLTTSAPLGVVGNTALIGHNNIYGDVFGHLVDLQVGDLILVYSGDKEFAYKIALRMILPERFQAMDVRLNNAQWIAPSQDERLTLVTCWPYYSNTHRLVIVATPIDLDTVQTIKMIPRLTPQPPLK